MMNSVLQSAAAMRPTRTSTANSEGTGQKRREGCHGVLCEAKGCPFFFSSRRRHTRCGRDCSSDVCSSDLAVNTFAFQYAWLKRSFHGDDLTNRQWAVKTGWKIYSQNRSGILVKSWDKFNVCTQSKVNFPYRSFPPRASPESPLGCGQGV